MAFVQGRDVPIQQAGQLVGRPSRGADIGRRAGLSVGGCALAVAKERALAWVGAGDLVAGQRRRRVGDNSRARANDLALLQRLGEARERLSLGAGEAEAAVALGVGAVRGTGRTSVERLVAIGCDDRSGQTEGAHHVAVGRTLAIDRADVFAVVEVERQADAVARLHLAFAVGKSIEAKATGDSAERVGLTRADF